MTSHQKSTTKTEWSAVVKARFLTAKPDSKDLRQFLTRKLEEALKNFASENLFDTAIVVQSVKLSPLRRR